MKSNSAIFYLFLLLFITIQGNLFAQSNPMETQLKSSYHQFDFWLGKWDVYRYDSDKLVGKSHIMSINDSTGLLEKYETVGTPFKGKSLNTYNKSSRKWEQYWTDNSGQILKLEGEFKEDRMVLENLEDINGNRITWNHEANNRVRQTWEVSTDGGKTWKVVFDGRYLRQSE